MTICDLDMTPAFERSKHHEEAARAGLPRTPSSSPMRIGESMCLLTLLPGTWRWYFVSARREQCWWKRTSDFLPMRDDPAAANPRLFRPAKLQNASHRPAPWHRNIKSYDVEIGTLDEAGLAGVRFVKADVEGGEREVLDGARATIVRDRPIILLELLSGKHDNPAAETAAICESFGYEAFIVQRGEKIAALPAISALGKNTSWGTDIESRNVVFLPR